jgi:ribosomal protein L12E/L44/L45/RPP1/RPP2
MRQPKAKMKTWKKVLIWVASIVVVLGVGGLFAANYAMDKMIAQLSASLEEELLEEVIATPTATPSGGGGETVDSPSTAETEDKGDEGTTKEDDNSGGQNSQSEGEGASNSSSNSTNDYSAEISTDKAKNVQDKITVSEKAQLASVFLKQLSMDDIKALQELASGGLGVDEKKEARTLILDRLTQEQYDELIEIAKKYGMSQGKSYEEVSKEK